MKNSHAILTVAAIVVFILITKPIASAPYPGYQVWGTITNATGGVVGANVTIFGNVSGFLWRGVSGTNGQYYTQSNLTVVLGENLTVNATYRGTFGQNSSIATGNGREINVMLSLDTEPPVVVLNSPLNNTNTADETPDFSFNVSDNLDTELNCTLYVYNQTHGNNGSTRVNTPTTITSSTISQHGAILWWVSCVDDGNNIGTSEKRVLTVGTDVFFQLGLIEAYSGIKYNDPANTTWYDEFGTAWNTYSNEFICSFSNGTFLYPNCPNGARGASHTSGEAYVTINLTLNASYIGVFLKILRRQDTQSNLTVYLDGVDKGNYSATFPYDRMIKHEIYLESLTAGQHNLTIRVSSVGNDDIALWDYILLNGTQGDDNPPVAVLLLQNPRIVVNTLTQFNGSSSYDIDPGDYIVSYNWTFGDSGTSAQAEPMHNYTSTGNYTVNLTVTDTTARTGKNTTNAYVCYEVSAGNCKPILNATANGSKTLTVHAGVPVLLNVSNSWDVDGLIIYYEWFDSMNETMPSGAADNPSVAAFLSAFNKTGLHVVTLNATDDTGERGSDNLTINVTNTPPIANATVNNAKSAVENTTQNLQFNASTSYDPDGDTLTYFWNFGDGTNNTSVAPTHAYTSPGRYNITLNVTDPFNASSVDSVTVTICLNGNCPPKAVAYVNVSQKSVTIHLGTLVNLTGTDSTDLNGKSDIVRYNWSDSNSDILPQQENITNFLFTYCGLHIVTLNVTDAGGLSDTDGVNVTVTNTAPLANGTANGNTTVVVNVSENVLFNASASYDPDGDTLTYFWNFDDGTNSTSILVTHNYSRTGAYEVGLTVTDTDLFGGLILNGSLNNTQTILVFVCDEDGCPPHAEAGPNRVVLANHTIYLNGSESFSVSNNITNYTWFFSDTGKNVSGVYVNHTFLSYGVYNVTLNVTDNSSLSDIDTIRVVVTWLNVTLFIDGIETTSFTQAGKPSNVTMLTKFASVSGYSGGNMSNVTVQLVEQNGYNLFVLPQYTNSNVTSYAIAEAITDENGWISFSVIPTGGSEITGNIVDIIGAYSLSLRAFVYGESTPSHQRNLTCTTRNLENPASSAVLRIPNRGDLGFYTLELAKIYDKVRTWFLIKPSDGNGKNYNLTVYSDNTDSGSGSITLLAGRPTGLLITVRNPSQSPIANAVVMVTETNGYDTFALPQYTNSNVTNYVIGTLRTNTNGGADVTIVPTGASATLGHESSIGNYSISLEVLVNDVTVYSRNLSVSRTLATPSLPVESTPNRDDANNFKEYLIISYDKIKRWLG